MKTRAGKGSTKASTEASETTISSNPKVQLGPDESNPPHLLILPKNASSDARIVVLEDPRYFSDSRYLICPENGFYEFKKVAAPKTMPRSWLLSQDSAEAEKDEKSEEKDDSCTGSKGYIMRNANLMIATPIDPLFLILPVLNPPTSKPSDAKKLFLSGDDYLEKMVTNSPHFAGFSRLPKLRSFVEGRMAAVCDTVDAGDETMYRLNEEMLLKELLKKATNISRMGLPASMEGKLVRKALEVPMLSIKREESSLHELAKEEDANAMETSFSTPAADTPDTQSTVASMDTAASSFSEASTAATSFSEDTVVAVISEPRTLPPISAPVEIIALLRLRTALFFILSSYLSPHISESIKKLVSSPTATVDFAPLDAHMANLTKLRQEAVAARSIGDYSRKRQLDEEETEVRVEKRRKEEEEKKRKANESRGVKALKKVNVSGMKKMSDFFKKK